MYFTVEDGKENCIRRFKTRLCAFVFFIKREDAKEIFKFNKKDELIGCIRRR